MIVDNLKSPNKSFLVKKKEKQYQQSRILFFTMPKIFWTSTKYEAKSGKESTMDQELDICNRVF